MTQPLQYWIGLTDTRLTNNQIINTIMNNTKIIQALTGTNTVAAFTALDTIRTIPNTQLLPLLTTLPTNTAICIVAYNIINNRLYGYVCTNRLYSAP